MARAALEIKFYVKLSVNDGDIEFHRQLVWRFDPKSIGSELVPDWGRLVDHPFALCEVSRELMGPKGQALALDLHDVRSLSSSIRSRSRAFGPVCIGRSMTSLVVGSRI